MATIPLEPVFCRFVTMFDMDMGRFQSLVAEKKNRNRMALT